MAKFTVDIRVTGRITTVVEADTLEQAKEQAGLMVTTEPNGCGDWTEFVHDLDEVDDADFSVHPLHLVIRNGERRYVSYVMATDEVIGR